MYKIIKDFHLLRNTIRYFFVVISCLQQNESNLAFRNSERIKIYKTDIEYYLQTNKIWNTAGQMSRDVHLCCPYF